MLRDRAAAFDIFIYLSYILAVKVLTSRQTIQLKRHLPKSARLRCAASEPVIATTVSLHGLAYSVYQAS